MSDALEHVRYSCGIAGEEVANYVDQLQAKVAELEEENARLRTVPMKYRRMAFNAQLQDENNELRAKLAAAQEEILIERSNGDHWRDAYSKWVNTDESARRLIELQEQLAKAEQRVAEACALQVATETRFHWLDAARVAKEIRSGEYRKFMKEV